MSSAYLLIPLGLVFLVTAVAALFWAVDSGQYDNLEEAGRAPLEPDEPGIDPGQCASGGEPPH